MHSLLQILQIVLNFARLGGVVAIALIAIFTVVTRAAQSKLSPGQTILVVASALLAGAAIWVLPSLINFVREDSNSIVPDYPFVGY